MKKAVTFFLIMFMCCGLAYATATKETNDTQARPVSAYGKTSGGAVIAIQVDDDGKLVTTGGGGAASTNQAESGTFTNADLDANFDVTISVGLTSSNLFVIDVGQQGSDEIEYRTQEPDNIYSVDTDSDGAYDAIRIEFGLAITGTYEWTVVTNGGLQTSPWTEGSTEVELSTSASGKTVVMDGSASVADDLTVTKRLIVDTDTLYVDATNDRVGIGTSSPNYDLEIKSDLPDLSFDETGTSSNWRIRLDGSDLLFTETGSSNHLVLETGGNVGIGTDDPSVLLDVDGGQVEITRGADSDAIAFRVNGADTTSEYGSISVVGGGVTGFYAGGVGSTSNSMALFTSFAGVETERVRILSNGNVGIGTTTPGSALVVVGDLDVSNDVTVDGDLYLGGSLKFIDTEGVSFDNDFQINGDLTVTGHINGETRVIQITGNRTLTVAEMYNTVLYVTATSNITLPALSTLDKDRVALNVIADAAVTVTVTPNASDGFRIGGATKANGVSITSSGTIEDECVIKPWYSSDAFYVTNDGNWT